MEECIPPVLKPDLDLLRLDVGQNGTFTDQLLTPERAWLRTLGVDTLQGLYLLRRVPNVLTVTV